MSLSDLHDFFGDDKVSRGARLFDEAMQERKAQRDTTPRTAEQARADRRLCDAEGHRYQVAGRLSPTRVQCSRCKCSWSIGPKTEPSS